MIWIVNGDDFETAEEVAQFIIDEADMSEEYDNMLDECCGDVNILGMTYCASEVLSRVDPIAYRCGYSDWQDSELSDIEYWVERMSDGDEQGFYDMTVKCEEFDEEEEEDEE